MNPLPDVKKVDFIQLPDGRRLRQVRLFISQPKLRAEPFEATVTVRQLLDMAGKFRAGAARVEEAARRFDYMGRSVWEKAFLNPDPNEEECAFCRHKARCNAALEKVRSTIIPFGAVEDLPEVLPAKRGEKPEEKAARRGKVTGYMPRDLVALNNAMKAAGFVEDWLLAVRAEAERVLLAGGVMEDFGLELGRQGNRTFKDPEGVTELLRKKFRLKLEDVFNLKLKTPTQLEELTKPGYDEEADKAVPPLLGDKRWAQVCALVSRGDPKPSVKSKALIKKPYKPDDIKSFAAVPEDEPEPSNPTTDAVDDGPMW